MKNIPQAVVNPVQFDRYGHIMEDYDLQGMVVKSIDLPWAPFLFDQACDENLTNCNSTGYLPEIFKFIQGWRKAITHSRKMVRRSIADCTIEEPIS